MRGYDDYNYPAFHAGAAKLRRLGWEVFSPAEHDVTAGFATPDEAAKPENLMGLMADDLRFILTEADALYLLPGWSKSSGANLELQAAQFKGIDVIYPDEWYYNEPSVDGKDIR